MNGDAHITEATQPGGAPVRGGGAESEVLGGDQDSAPKLSTIPLQRRAYVKARTHMRHAPFASDIKNMACEEAQRVLELITRPEDLDDCEFEEVLAAVEEAA